MYYEIQAKITENGKTTTHKYITDCLLYAEAEHAILQEHPANETYTVKQSRIKEIANNQDDNDKTFIATLAQEFDIDGKKKKMKYDVLLFAIDFDEARHAIREYLRQGYDGMELVKLSESKIEGVL